MSVVGQAVQGGTSWAKVRLTRGQSAGGVWEIDQQYPQARLAIGSDAAAGWVVQGPGVRAMHFELYWDGRCLFVADTQRVGGVTLNGAPLGGDWTQVRGRGEVVFGQAAVAIETSDGQASAQPDAASARRISSTEGPSAPHPVGELSGEATRMTDGTWDPAPSLTGEATRIQDSPLDAPPPGTHRPRLGGNDGPASGQAKTLMQDELSSAVNEATRMVAMPDGPPSIVVSPNMGGPNMGGPNMGGPQQPMQPPMGGGGFGGGPPPPGQGGPFAAPSGFGEAPPPMTKQPSKISGRIIVMVVALLFVIPAAAYLAFYDDAGDYDVPVASGVPPTVVAPPTTMAAPPPTPIPTGAYIPPQPTGVAIPPQPTDLAIPPQPTGVVIPPQPIPYPPQPTAIPLPPPTSAVVPPTTAVDPSIPLPPTPERLAADQVLAGRYSDALPLYQTLALQHPERPEYSAMVGILEQRIRAAQCVNGIGPDGRMCVPTH